MIEENQTDLRELRSIIVRHKRWDLIFLICGVLALMIAILTFIALFLNMLIDGLPRLSWEFFTSYPSRRAESAGILSAWVGTTLVMLVTAVSGYFYMQKHPLEGNKSRTILNFSGKSGK